MTLDARAPRTRRALLGAVAGSTVAAVAAALGQAAGVRAANGEPLTAGQTVTAASETILNVDAGTADTNGLSVISNATTGYHIAVRGLTASSASASSGVFGAANASSGEAAGVSGISFSPDGYGVAAYNIAGTGSARGLNAEVSSNEGIGVMAWAISAAGSTTGIKGRVSSPDGTAVIGVCDSATGATTGVKGEVASPGGTAVRGKATAAGGRALVGEVGSAATGIGIEAFGRVRFPNRSGVATVASGGTSVKVTVAGVTSANFAIATLATNRSGTWVRAVTCSKDTVTVYLNKAASAATRVTWLVLG